METLAWTTLAAHLDTALPFVITIGGTKGVEIGHEPTSASLFFRVPVDEETTTTLASAEALHISSRQINGKKFLDVRTKQEHFYRELHHFAVLFCEDLESSSSPPHDILTLTLARWRAFAKRSAEFSVNEQIGLYGELLLLGSLVSQAGTKAIEWWTGRKTPPASQDFRLPQADIEVKSTLLPRHEHHISSIDQLQARNDTPLYVLSFRFEDGGGASQNIRDLIENIEKQSEHDKLFVETLAACLAASGYDRANPAHNSLNLRTAGPARLIHVDERFPSITSQRLASALGHASVQRVREIQYIVDLEGLGVSLEDSSLKMQIFPLLRDTHDK